MNREDIIRMAHESHLDVYGLGKDYAKFADVLERFAKLVRDDYSTTHANLWLDRIHKFVLEEREACIKIVEDEAMQYAEPVWAFEIVNDIKARGHVATNDTSQECVDKTSEIVHEPEYLAFMDTPQRKPLSDEEILTYKHMIDWTAEWSYINFARAIEAAHGIKGEA